MVPDFVSRILDNMKTVVVANQEVLESALVSVLAEGHFLIEDVPGIGKTTLAKTLAKGTIRAIIR